MISQVNSSSPEDPHQQAELLGAVLRCDLYAFLEFCFLLVDERNRLIRAPYIELLTYVLDEFAHGEKTRLIINLPPRHLKSVLTSIVLPAFLLVRDPRLRIAVISHSQSLARDLGLKCLRLITSPQFQDMFPRLSLSPDRCSATDFETRQGGGRYAASLETGVTGRGFDFIIVDDPLSAHNARSEAEREKVNETYDTMIASRLDDPSRGGVIIVHQRLHEDDLTGHLLAKPSAPWTHIALPLVAEEAAEYQIGSKIWRREIGDALIPELYAPDEIARIRSERGAPIFSAHYQQNPAAACGELIEPQHLRFFDEMPSGAFSTVFSCDTALKNTPTSSYSVCMVIKTNGTDHYIVDVMRRKLDPKQLSDTVLGMLMQHGPDKILIEEASTGPGLAFDLKETGHASELRSTRGLSKQERLEKHLRLFVAGRIFIKEGQPWTVELHNELSRFPYSMHTDQVDALSQYLEWSSEKTPHKPFVHHISASEQRLSRSLPLPQTRKGDNPLRPRSGPFSRLRSR